MWDTTDVTRGPSHLAFRLASAEGPSQGQDTRYVELRIQSCDFYSCDVVSLSILVHLARFDIGSGPSRELMSLVSLLAFLSPRNEVLV